MIKNMILKILAWVLFGSINTGLHILVLASIILVLVFVVMVIYSLD